jgi:nicotinamidase-related amidase
MAQIAGGLIERERSCLIVVDVQQYFLDKLPLHDRGPLVQRMAWLMRVARALDIPIVATAEDVERNGPLVPDLAGLLPPEIAVFNKMIFGLMSQADIRAAVAATGRDCFVLVGLETDVCIAHSALGLAAAGHRVVVIDDACASPPPHHDHGLRRLRDAGITVTSVKGLYYEWVRDLATYHWLKPQLNVALPEGLTL